MVNPSESIEYESHEGLERKPLQSSLRRRKLERGCLCNQFLAVNKETPTLTTDDDKQVASAAAVLTL